MLLLTLLACQEYNIDVQQIDLAFEYQETVLDFMCGDDVICWDEMSVHWAYCLVGTETVEPALVESCQLDMDASEDGFLSHGCFVSQVVIPNRPDGEDCF